MPIDHPSDLPDDADRTDEWRAVKDGQAPGGRRSNPPELAAEQPKPSADGRPDDLSQASSDALAVDSERLNPGEQQGDDERRAPDTQPVDEARPDASTAAAEAPDPPETATAEPRTRQEHADTDHPEGSPDPAGAWSDESHSKHPQSPDATDGQQQFEDEQSTSNADYPRDTEDAEHETLVAGLESDKPKDQFIESTIETDPDRGVGPDFVAEPSVDKTSNQASPSPRDEISNADAPDQRADVEDSTRSDRSPSSGSDPNVDNPVRPLTDAEWVEHVTEVIDRLGKARAAGLETHLLYTIDPDNQSWSRDRRALHTSIINDLYDKAMTVPNEGSAIIAGGLGGAGKTTVLTTHANIDTSRFLIINPDNIKEEMARRGMIPSVEGLSPMEASDLVHEESSYLARHLAIRAQSERKNLIWDITMSDREKTEKRIDDLRASGYTSIEGIFVDISGDLSIQRTESRHREGHEKYRAGEGLGGRYVPREVVDRQKDPQWGSTNKKTFHGITEKFNRWSIYDNSIDGRPAILIDSDRHHNRSGGRTLE